MKNCYSDILVRIPEAPLWWDENGVPRYDAFGPDAVADIYCCEAALVEIRCQNCGHPFEVAFSWYHHSGQSALSSNPHLFYGDPPNMGCCEAGASMSSESVRVLQFWRKNRKTRNWERVPRLEITYPFDGSDEIQEGGVEISPDLQAAMELKKGLLGG